MTSTCMALYKYNTVVNNDICYPPNLNNWLNANGGYEDGDLLVWNSVHVLSPHHLTLKTFVDKISQSQIQAEVKNCNPVIPNVRSGTHWVLIIGYDDADVNTYYTLDPGYNQSKYSYSDMSWFVVYQPAAYTNETNPELAKAHQQKEAILQK